MVFLRRVFRFEFDFTKSLYCVIWGLFVTVFSLSFFSLAPFAEAATCTFVSFGGSHDFNDVANWADCGNVPITGDSAVIPALETVSMETGTAFSFDALYATGTLNILNKEMTVTGETLVDVGATVTSTGGTLTFGGTVSSTGAIGSETGNMLFSSTFQNNGVFDLGTGYTTSSNTITNDGVWNGGSGTLTLEGGNLYGSGTMNPGIGTVRFAGFPRQEIMMDHFFNLNVEKPSAYSAWSLTGLRVDGSVYVAPGSFLELNQEGFYFFVHTVAGNFINDGVVNLSEGSLSVSSTFTNAGQVYCASPACSLKLAGDFVNSGTIVDSDKINLQFLGSSVQSIGGAMWSSLLLNKDAGEVGFTASTTIFGAFNADSGTLNAQNASITVLGTTTLLSGTVVTSTGGSLLFDGSVTSTGSIGSETGNMLFSSTFQNNGTFDVGSGTATTTGDLTNAGTVNGGSGNIALFQDFINNGGTFNAQSGTFTYTGDMAVSGDRVVPGFLFNDLSFRTYGEGGLFGWSPTTTVLGDLYVSPSSNDSSNIGGPGVLTIVGDLRNEGVFGVYLASGPVTVHGDIINSGAFYGGNATTSLEGNLTNTGAFYAEGGTFNFFGDADKTADGVIYNDLHLTKALNRIVTLNTSSTILGNLLLEGPNMVVPTGADLTVVGTTFSDGNALIYINGGNATFSGNTTSTRDLYVISGNAFFGGDVYCADGLVLIDGAVTSTGIFTNNGPINMTGGTLTFVGGLTQYGTLSSGNGTIVYAGSGLSVAPEVYNNLSIRGTATFGGSSASTTVAGTLNIDPGATLTVTNEGTSFEDVHLLLLVTTTNAGTLTMAAGGSYGPTVTSTLAFTNTGTINAAGILDFQDSFTNSGTFNPGSSYVRYTGSSASNIGAAVYNLLDLAGSTTYSLTASTTALATTTIASTATLNLGSTTATFVGDIDNSGHITGTSTGSLVHPLDYVRITNDVGTVVPTLEDGGSLFVTLSDQSRNLDGSTPDVITVPFTSNAAAGSDNETLTLTETGAKTGIFRNTTAMSVRGASVVTGNGFVDLANTGIGTATYTDAFDITDTSSTIVSLSYTPPVITRNVDTGGGALTTAGGVISAPLTIGSLSLLTRTPLGTAPSISTPPAPEISVGTDQTPPSVPERITILLRDDARSFGIILQTPQERLLGQFIQEGSDEITRHLGEGERRALVRDLFDTLRTGAISLADIERVASGRIPLARNLPQEQIQLPRVHATFQHIFGHNPIFSSAQENLAWNTFMYRIRFPRDLTLEQLGIARFQATFHRLPRDPFQWSVVRVLGYVRR